MAIPHDDSIARGTAGHLTQIPDLALAHRPLARTLDQDRYFLAQERQVILQRDLILDGKQIQIPPMLDLLRDVVGKQLGSLGPWPYAVLVYETVFEATTFDHLDGLLKVLLGLSAKTDDEVARYGRPRQHVSDAIHHRIVVARRVTPLHPLEDHIAAALGRHVQIRHALWQVPDRLEQLACHVLGVTGHKFDPFDPLDRMEHLQQIGQPRRSLPIDPTVGIDRLT